MVHEFETKIDSINDLAEEFDAHNIDFEDGLEDVEEVVYFGVVTECFFVGFSLLNVFSLFSTWILNKCLNIKIHARP